MPFTGVSDNATRWTVDEQAAVFFISAWCHLRLTAAGSCVRK